MTGRTGPSFRTCRDHYAASDSPIFRDDVLFEFENGDYRGAQGFRVPRDGVYNITVVGAAGARGICNHVLGGKAVKRTVQVKLSTEFDLLVMVGQRGLEPCTQIPISEPAYTEVCSNPPLNINETVLCNETWYNLTRKYDSLFYEVFGGAGGGGASLVRARNRTSEMFDDFPIVVTGGGSGTPAVLQFDGVDVVDVGDQFPSGEEGYRAYLNGQFIQLNPVFPFSLFPGIRGNRISDGSKIAGAGGGYSIGLKRLIEVDGRAFRSPLNFANGGIDCAQPLYNIRMDNANAIPFHGTFGGFGGGGGACGGSGGGGGYTGGAVQGIGNTIPGGGGYSYTGDAFFTSFNVTHIVDTLHENRTDGFVDIVLANCGCVYECTVFEEADQFDCRCPKDATLAPDLSDCFYSKKQTM